MVTKKKTVKGDILIVDSVPENLTLLFDILNNNDYEIRVTLSGKEALTIIDIDLPDLILLNFKLSDTDGYEVCSNLTSSEKTKNVPIIFISTLNDSIDEKKAFQVGAVDYIEKPFEVEEVLTRLNHQFQLISMGKQIEEQNLILSQKNRELKKYKKEFTIVSKELEAYNYQVSHDIRNHLQAIIGFSEILRYSLKDTLDEESLEYIKLINEAGNLIDKFIKELSRLSKINNAQLEYQEIDLGKISHEIIYILKNQHPEREIEFKIQPNLFLKGDADLLYIAIENLLKNAWKFTIKQKKPVIEISSFTRKNVESNLEETVYFVKDNGVGFDMEKADKIFIPFNQLHEDEEFEGTGIGLATVYKIINLHDGDIWFEAKENQGATFYFTLRQI